MTGRVALVTGGTRGIGAAIAAALHDNGYQVAVTYVSDERAALAFSLQTGIPALQLDGGDAAACKAGIQRLTEKLGPIEVLVNNAGITRDAMLHRMQPDHWAAVIQANLTACFNLCREVVPGMREREFGRIINIGSINGQTGQLGQTAYAAAKAGLHGFTMALAREGASKGITANLVAPGYIDTDMVRTVNPEVLQRIIAQIPVGRLGSPEEVARTVLFLASDESGFITGSTLTVNGGHHMA
ncbi:acetoacetyl-CoA reductase [Vitiosangium sp. GDMCC 1.1324]|uniref:acetoacetyl-CoA reductase n=1 Tax=Vitiosangium sp. (strain GDMCC 1.1324) TaxID=2138576 RepID=UPI000D385449|nr:acetoacetyl-CoA reductase [Vitiosangium sp. GDMCC 1.1324]PTL84291.1 beta-ketoacyl-ACP reductase [Vitiosangium sp. GDMCC 1.1324]